MYPSKDLFKDPTFKKSCVSTEVLWASYPLNPTKPLLTVPKQQMCFVSTAGQYFLNVGGTVAGRASSRQQGRLLLTLKTLWPVLYITARVTTTTDNLYPSTPLAFTIFLARPHTPCAQHTCGCFTLTKNLLWLRKVCRQRDRRLKIKQGFGEFFIGVQTTLTVWTDQSASCSFITRPISIGSVCRYLSRRVTEKRTVENSSYVIILNFWQWN